MIILIAYSFLERFSPVVLDLKLMCHIVSPYILTADLLGVITADLFYMVSLGKDYNVKVMNNQYLVENNITMIYRLQLFMYIIIYLSPMF